MNWHEQAADILNKLPGVKLGSGSLDGAKVTRLVNINDIGEVHIALEKGLRSAYEAGVATSLPVSDIPTPKASSNGKAKPKASK